MNANILIVEDDQTLQNILQIFFENNSDYNFEIVWNTESALEILKEQTFDIVITDKNLPGQSTKEDGGIEILKYIQKNCPNTEAMMMTGYSSVDTATEAMKLGAFDYICKPFSLTELKDKIDRILEYKSHLGPNETIYHYKNFYKDVLTLIQNNNSLYENEKQDILTTFEKKIDYFFKGQKNLEQIIVAQREALQKASSHADELLDHIKKSDPAYDLLLKILDDTSNRV